MDVKLPKLGEGADSGVVVSLLVKEGEEIQKGQTLLELENEKAVAPIPSPVAGTVTRLRVKEGDKLSVGQVILSIAEAGKPAGAPAPAEAKEKKPAPKTPAAAAPEPPEAVEEPEEEEEAGAEAPSSPAPAASPSIRRIARELGIDLARVRGSERGGRIVMADLRAYVQRLQKLASQAAPEKGPKPATTAERLDFSKWGPIAKRPLTPLRRTISRRMAESWTTIPHVTQFHEADVTALDQLRKQHGPAYEAKGARLTLTVFVLKALVEVLKKHPTFNASLDEAAEELVCKEYYHFGIAVDTDAGLIVPVIRDVDKKDALQLSKELQELAVKARERKVTADELKGGTFTISNQGGIGGGHFTPIVNKPEVAILGLGRGAERPAVREGKIEPRLILPLALSYDHRVIDGGSAARFVTDLAQALENFSGDAVKL
jgi:pyruvate dehydrogenase E2 component (dihydrolipoamide acetyltransferase)